VYITDGQLFTYVTALLHRSQANAEVDAPFLMSIVQQANASAYGYIVRGLASRGYGPVTQIPQWDDGANFQKSIGAFLALTDNGSLGNAFDDKFLEKLDRREELKTVQVTIGGVWKAPDGTTVLEIDVLPVATNTDYFGPAMCPGDPRIGEPQRW
jgi:hypothetical protein